MTKKSDKAINNRDWSQAVFPKLGDGYRWSALLYQKIKQLLKHSNVMFADNIDTLHLANVWGGLKLWRLYDALKALCARYIVFD